MHVPLITVSQTAAFSCEGCTIKQVIVIDHVVLVLSNAQELFSVLSQPDVSYLPFPRLPRILQEYGDTLQYKWLLAWAFDDISTCAGVGVIIFIRGLSVSVLLLLFRHHFFYEVVAQ